MTAKMIYLNKKLIILSVLLFSCLLSAQGYYTKEEISNQIYFFQRLINQEEEPTIADYRKLFSSGEGDRETLMTSLYCATNNEFPYCNKPDCKDKFDINHRPSLFLRYLRSQDSPIFNGKDRSKIRRTYLWRIRIMR